MHLYGISLMFVIYKLSVHVSNFCRSVLVRLLNAPFLCFCYCVKEMAYSAFSIRVRVCEPFPWPWKWIGESRTREKESFLGQDVLVLVAKGVQCSSQERRAAESTLLWRWSNIQSCLLPQIAVHWQPIQKCQLQTVMDWWILMAANWTMNMR